MVNKKILSLPLLVDAVDKMHDKKGFSISKLRRKFSSILHTSQLNDSFGLSLNEGGAIHCRYIESEGVVLVYYSTRTRQSAEIRFHVNSNKQFMQKVLRQQLFNANPYDMNQFNKDLVINMMTAHLNCSQYTTLDLIFNLHMRLSIGKTCRQDCSFQVLNAYDMFYKYRHWFADEHLDWIYRQAGKIDAKLLELVHLC